MRELKAYEDGVLLDGYLAEAVWFWFDASTVEKRLECGLHRVAARCILSEIRKRGLDVPDEDLVFQQARLTFPPDDLTQR